MIKLDKQQSDELSRLLQQYCETELDYELGQFEAQFMLDFIADKIAPHFYNQGIRDAQTVLNSKIDDINHALYEIEKIV